MVKVFEGTDKEYYLDGYTKNLLDQSIKYIKQDWDMMFIVDGEEGSGKSVLSQQNAFYCDQSFNIDRVAMTPEELLKVITTNKEKYKSFTYDEALGGLSTRNTMSKTNKLLVGTFAECRQQNMFGFITLPSFFDLDKNLALWRVRGLFHTYKDDDWRRGYFAFYDRDKLKQLYLLGKKFYNYKCVKPNFIGRFTNKYVLDETEYRRKKKKALKDKRKLMETDGKDEEKKQLLFNKVMELGGEIPHSVKMKILELPESTYYFQLKRWKEDKKDANSIET